MKNLIALFIILLLFIPQRLSAQEDRLSQWEENLAVLVAELPQRHVDPFTQISEAEFMAAAESLRADLPTLSDEQILIRMAALVAMLGDSHTVLAWELEDPLYPISLLPFDDGLYVVAIVSDSVDVPGAKLVRINGHSIEDVITQVQTIIPHENQSWLMAQLPNFLIRSEVLIGLGIVEGVEAVPWEFETPAGETITVEIAPISPTEVDASQLQVARSSTPRTESTSGNYWLEQFDDGTLYFKYNSAVDAADLPMAQFIEILLAALAEQPIERLVIDVRSNTGGSSFLIDPLITALRDHPINVPGKLFVIIGARTYSSAMINALRLSEETEAVLVGQATGGAPNHFGELLYYDLPHFGLRFTYSTNYFELLPGVEGNTLLPDVPVALTIEDYLAGIDPAYAAMMAYEP